MIQTPIAMSCVRHHNFKSKHSRDHIMCDNFIDDLKNGCPVLRIPSSSSFTSSSCIHDDDITIDVTSSCASTFNIYSSSSLLQRCSNVKDRHPTTTTDHFQISSSRPISLPPPQPPSSSCPSYTRSTFSHKQDDEYKFVRKSSSTASPMSPSSTHHQCHVNMFVVIILFYLSFVKSVLGAQYVAPGECKWNHVASIGFDVSLRCNIKTISTDDSLNFNLIQAEHTINLTLICDDTLTESRMSPSALSHLRYLRSLRIESCKLTQIVGEELRGLESLRNLTIRSHSPEWSGLSLHLNHTSFDHLRKIELLDLGYNNIAHLPSDLFCPLTNLKVLNLTHNRIVGFASLGVVDHTYGHLCSQELQELDMSHNGIEYVSKESVANLKNMRTLLLDHNMITEIEEISLSALNRLQRISLASNKLVQLPSRLFRGSQELLTLNLQNNSLHHLETGLLKGLAKLLTLNLSHNQITSDRINKDTFVDLIRVVELDLSYNKLKRIRQDFFGTLYSLQVLNLAYNSITHIEDYAFVALYNLHLLILDGNKLKTIEPYMFEGPVVLSELSLNENEISSIHMDSLKNCSSLRSLYLKGNSLAQVPRAIGNLRELKTLNLASNVITIVDSINGSSPIPLRHLHSLDLSENAIYELDRDFTKDIINLEQLDLSGNQFERLEPGIFDHALGLKEIYLQNNKLADINGLFVNLKHLKVLNVSQNRITWFEFAMIPEGLKVLDIHTNLIKELGNYYQKVCNTSKIDFSHNRLTRIEPWLVPNATEVLLLNNNNITFIHPSTFVAKSMLSFVDLRHNHLSGLDMNAFSLKLFQIPANRPLPTFLLSSNPYLCDCKMEWLQRVNREDSGLYPMVADLDMVMCKLPFVRESSDLPLVKANSSNFLCKYKTHCFALCHCCEFDACDCEMMCPDNCTCYHDQTWATNVVDCSRREYTALPARIPMDVTELYLDGNQLSGLTSHTFIGRKNMVSLYLNNSGIKQIANRTFNGLTLLQVLHLEHNFISSLSGWEFVSLGKLRELHLHHNRISYVNHLTFSNLTSLQVLHLEDNAIVDFQLWQLSRNQHLSVVQISNNLWTCRCEFVPRFQEWLNLFGGIVRDKDTIRCHHNSTAVGPYIWQLDSTKCTNISLYERSSNGAAGGYISGNSNSIGGDIGGGLGYSVISSDGLSELNGVQPNGGDGGEIMLPTSLVQNYMPITLAVVFFVSTLLIVTILIIVYHKEINMWIYSNYGFRCFHKSRYTPETEKLFDAFVSYCKKDEAFISQILAPELECGHPPYRLCLRYRDLPVTGYVTEAITEAIESSHRTIIVLSNQYLKSDSCLFELKVAHQECQVNRNHRLIVVVLERNSINELDPDGKICLRSAPIIHWGDRRFWEKLRYSMPPGRYSKPPGHCPDVRASIDFKRSIHLNAV
ncbi:toll-like receptor Tollo [Brevipalpus obovatus]|uniref:toll-like receptor Tollo n=1 Tax=Brevipalpus obovatus TaxID=246614 RepID=UPI003D9DBC20